MSVQTIKKHLSSLSRVEQAEIMHFMVELLAKGQFIQKRLKEESVNLIAYNVENNSITQWINY